MHCGPTCMTLDNIANFSEHQPRVPMCFEFAVNPFSHRVTLLVSDSSKCGNLNCVIFIKQKVSVSSWHILRFWLELNLLRKVFVRCQYFVIANIFLPLTYWTRLRLSLYRHWSLFDSICHSRYTACRFVWFSSEYNWRAKWKTMLSEQMRFAHLA